MSPSPAPPAWPAPGAPPVPIMARGPREVSLRPEAHHLALETARQRQTTPEFQAQYAARGRRGHALPRHAGLRVALHPLHRPREDPPPAPRHRCCPQCGAPGRLVDRDPPCAHPPGRLRPPDGRRLMVAACDDRCLMVAAEWSLPQSREAENSPTVSTIAHTPISPPVRPDGRNDGTALGPRYRPDDPRASNAPPSEPGTGRRSRWLKGGFTNGPRPLRRPFRPR